jgi:hypothetical protein
MAFYEIEPFGDEVEDLRHGTACALLANTNRDRESRPEPFGPSDFIHWGDAAGHHVEAEPVLLDDPVAQSNLIKAQLFGIGPRPDPER